LYNLVIPTLITGAVCLLWLFACQTLSAQKIHIGTGFVYICCWGLYYKDDIYAKYAVAMVPAGVVLQFSLIGLGLIKDEKAVKSMSRSGAPHELLYGPVTYGIVIVLSTIIYWVDSPIGITATSVLCCGDGFAGLVGEAIGKHRLPYNKHKSMNGTMAFFAASFVGSIVYLMIIQSYGYLAQLSILAFIPSLLLVCIVCTLVESLPIDNWDNVTVFLSCVVALKALGW
ncbi:hypothetical protein SAMD00019534_033520, partial [Acytostelium subglobosum LB1]|uniref:hypothetical protein n=1 Tax=Acytostelium subglobosum LB1 TaxID=1410327 RepID=UPI0006451BF7